MTRQYCHIGSRTIAYLDSVPGGNALRTIVLLHAFPLGAGMWEPQIRSIPKGWRLITPDLCGFGGTTDPNPTLPAIDDYADDVTDLLGELGITRAVVGGCSMGGYATFAVMRKVSHMVEAIVLADTKMTADTSEGRANRRSMLALVDREGPSGVSRDMMPKLLGATTVASDATIEPTVRRFIKQQSPDALRGAIRRMMDRPDSSELATTITVPALIVVGEEDALTPVADAQKMAAAIPGARLEIIPGAGHLPNLEQPARFNTVLGDFLSSLP
ncbi:MAG: alpha/beta hydrolase [Acidobacteria bacterium]|nr:alpha/beta hydrolase [Acidobacteriota bacterium]